LLRFGVVVSVFFFVVSHIIQQVGLVAQWPRSSLWRRL
jgi:hypothetical protein